MLGCALATLVLKVDIRAEFREKKVREVRSERMLATPNAKNLHRICLADAQERAQLPKVRRKGSLISLE